MAENQPADRVEESFGERSQRYLAILFGSLALIIMLQAIYRTILVMRVEFEIDSIRQAEYPVTLPELDEWYKRVPEDQNIALFIRDAISRSPSLVGGDVEKEVPLAGKAPLPSPGWQIAPHTRNAIKEYLLTHDDALRVLHESIKRKGRSRYEVNLANSPNPPLEHLAELVSAAKLMALEIIELSERRMSGKAIEALVHTLKVTNTLTHEPLLQSQITRIECEELCILALERIISRSIPNDPELEDISDAITAAEAPDAVMKAMMSARARGIHLFRKLKEVDPKNSPTIWDRLYTMSGMQDLDNLLYLNVMDEYLKASQAPLVQREFLLRKLTEKFDGVSAYRSSMSKELLDADLRFVGLIQDEELTEEEQQAKVEAEAAAQIAVEAAAAGDDEAQAEVDAAAAAAAERDENTVPQVSIIGVIERDVAHTALLRASRIAVAVERYRLRNNKMPLQLEDLAPRYLSSVPQDPFTGRPMKFAKLGGSFLARSGYVIYSVGPNGQDDGGVPQSQAISSDRSGWQDIAFVVER